MATEPTQQKQPPGVQVDADMVLTVTEGGQLVVVHRRFIEPLPIDMTQLRNWLRRQLKETV